MAQPPASLLSHRIVREGGSERREEIHELMRMQLCLPRERSVRTPSQTSMTSAERAAHYGAQNGTMARLTPKQQRRLKQKAYKTP
jgi:hypothetical protein